MARAAWKPRTVGREVERKVKVLAWAVSAEDSRAAEKRGYRALEGRTRGATKAARTARRAETANIAVLVSE